DARKDGDGGRHEFHPRADEHAGADGARSDHEGHGDRTGQMPDLAADALHGLRAEEDETAADDQENETAEDEEGLELDVKDAGEELFTEEGEEEENGAADQ